MVQDSELMTRLRNFNFDQKGPYPYSQRLAKDNAWPYAYGLLVIEEYRKFLYLATISKSVLSPSPDVEKAWRLHLIYSTSYRQDLCQMILKAPLAHHCDDGTESKSTLSHRFAVTLSLYRTHFGKPPEDIWCEPESHGTKFFQRCLVSVRMQSQVWRWRHANWNDAKIPDKHQKLWRSVSTLPLDRPRAAYPFFLRLADENQWTHEQAFVAIEEYRKFIYLLCTTGHWVTPAQIVDQVWHLHLANTESYWAILCEKISGKSMHHHPGNGDSKGGERFKAIYQRTLADYTKVFGEPPPSVWGKPNPNIDWAFALADSGY